MGAILPKTGHVVRVTPDTAEEREERFTRLAAAVEKALVERREVQPARAKAYVDHARGQVSILDREMELSWLACSFDLIGVIAE